MSNEGRNGSMKKIIRLVAWAAGGVMAADPAATPLEADWRNGFHIRSADDTFELRPRVMVQFDVSTYSEEDLDDSASAAAEADSDSPS